MAGTGGMTELQERAWGGFLRTHEALWRELERRIARVGLSLAEYDVLLALRDAGAEGMRMSDLAERRLMSTGGFTRLADRLERRELIARRRSVEDGRSLRARMTPQGKALLRRAMKAHHQDVDEVFFQHLTTQELKHLSSIWAALTPAE